MVKKHSGRRTPTDASGRSSQFSDRDDVVPFAAATMPPADDDDGTVIDLDDDDEPEPVRPIECRAHEVEFTLEWTAANDRALTGSLQALNVSSRTWQISDPPGLIFYSVDGSVLPSQHLIRPIGMVPERIKPGQTAETSVSWNWDGTPVARVVGIRWQGGTVDVEPTGPLHPVSPVPRMISSSNAFLARERQARRPRRGGTPEPR